MKKRKNGRFGNYLALLPALIWLAALFLYPLADTLSLALFPLGRNSALWKAIEQPEIRQSLARSFGFVVLSVPAELVLGIAVGSLLGMQPRRKQQRLFFFLVATPLLMPSVVVGLMWRNLLDPLRGVLSYYALSLFHFHLGGFSSGSSALITLTLCDVWQWSALVAVFVAAVLVNTVDSKIELAELDGLSLFGCWQKVLWPKLRSVVILLLMLRTVDCLRTFDLVYITTQGGPGTATELLGFTIYEYGFSFLDRHLVAGSSALLLLTSSIILLLLVRLFTARGSVC